MYAFRAVKNIYSYAVVCSLTLGITIYGVSLAQFKSVARSVVAYLTRRLQLSGHHFPRSPSPRERAKDQVYRKMTSWNLAFLDWTSIHTATPPTHRRPKNRSVKYGALQARKVRSPPGRPKWKTDFEKVYSFLWRYFYRSLKDWRATSKLIAHFRVAVSLLFKPRPSAKRFIWIWVFFHMQIKLISIWMVLHLTSVWKGG